MRVQLLKVKVKIAFKVDLRIKLYMTKLKLRDKLSTFKILLHTHINKKKLHTAKTNPFLRRCIYDGCKHIDLK